MQTYSDQYDYERIMAMSEAEFDYIKDSIIEGKKEEIRKHNKDIDEQNRSINSEINALLEENVSLKRELEEITNEIGNTGKYNKDNVSILNNDETKNKIFITVDDKNINDFIDFMSGFEMKEFNNIKETLEDFFMKFYKEDKDFGGALNG